jgi:hypothetical protein
MSANNSISEKARDLLEDPDFMKTVYVGAAVTALLLGLFLYYRHITYRQYHRGPALAKETAPATPAVPEVHVQAAPVVAATTHTYTSSSAQSPVAAEPSVADQVKAMQSSAAQSTYTRTAHGTNSAAKPAPGPSLGDSMMAALSPSAHAETIQQPLEPAVPRIIATPSHRRLLPPEDPEATMTDEQKLAYTANNALDKLLDMAVKTPDPFGFTVDDKLADAKLAAPMRVYTVAENDRKEYADGQPIKDILQPTEEWIYPVVLNDEVRYMISIKHVGKHYVSSIGSRALAMSYEKIQEQWPESAGYHTMLVVNASIQDYYFTIPEMPEQNLTSTREMFEYSPKLSPATVILASWR